MWLIVDGALMFDLGFLQKLCLGAVVVVVALAPTCALAGDGPSSCKPAKRANCEMVLLLKFMKEEKSKAKEDNYRYGLFRWLDSIDPEIPISAHLSIAFKDSQLSGAVAHGKHIVERYSYWIVFIPSIKNRDNANGSLVCLEDGGLVPYSPESLRTALKELCEDTKEQARRFEKLDGMVQADLVSSQR